MSFTTLKIAELRQIAEDFAVDLPNSKNKAEIIAALAEEGVTWDVYQKTIKNIEEETVETEEVLPKFDPKKEQPEDTVLVRMTRANFRYDAMGFTFTREHPFVAMPTDKAEEIFEKEEGFRLATPKEVQDFYA
jgi:hypothetical protein